MEVEMSDKDNCFPTTKSIQALKLALETLHFLQLYDHVSIDEKYWTVGPVYVVFPVPGYRIYTQPPKICYIWLAVSLELSS